MLRKIGFIVPSLIVGLLFGFLFSNYEYFQFDSEINLIDLLNLMVSVFLAVYISIYLADKNSKNHVKRDYTIKEINEVSMLHKQLKSCADANQYPFETTKAHFKEINLQLVFLEQILGKTNCEALLNEIKLDLRYLRRVITNPSPQKGSIVLEGRDALKVEKRLNAMRSNIYNLLIFVIEK